VSPEVTSAGAHEPAEAQSPIATVQTRYFALAQTVAQMALRQYALAGFFGEPGTGKTHAMRHFCAHCDVETVYVTASPSPQAKEIYEEILLGTVGEVRPGSARELRRLCAEVLSERPRVLVVDECQNLSALWHQQLRSLHDYPNARFALLLSGGVNAERTLQRDPQLWSRVKLRVEFARLEGAELLECLSKLHPALANTDPDLLGDIDLKDCRGNLRNWVSVLELALPMLPGSRHPDRLTPKEVRAVFSVRGIK
jgi:DNA transposition AAA+ family ATPase